MFVASPKPMWPKFSYLLIASTFSCELSLGDPTAVDRSSEDLVQARGASTHRCAQDQQRHWTGVTMSQRWGWDLAVWLVVCHEMTPCVYTVYVCI